MYVDFLSHTLFCACVDAGKVAPEDGKQPEAIPVVRTFGVGHLEPEVEGVKFVDNGIKTSKYTWWNFIFKNLFMQFRRVSNVYFLVMVILSKSLNICAWVMLAPLPQTH